MVFDYGRGGPVGGTIEEVRHKEIFKIRTLIDIFQLKTDCVYSDVLFSVRVLSSALYVDLVADFVTTEGQATIPGLQKQTEAKLTGMVPR